ncbi:MULTISPECIES: hypothetical protein [unclassified Streptomyces]|uniref:hypothetical protein n=1 Tax=unclassified Streptomyces TaxID=2593676 RepID=UPI002E119E95|nr:hypothetical protein OG452_20045 [Streptomyces sp. NBC_01197]WSS49870.1 hypothetical protein OG708_15210 [Streptomyces sp. NBC_01180]
MTTDGGQWAVGSGGFGAPVPTGWAYAPSAPQPGTVPLRPLDSGDIMRGVLTTMPRYARPLYLPLLAFALGFTVLLSGCALAAWTLITPLPAPGTRTTTPHLLEMAEVIGIAALPLLIYATVAYAATATVSTTVLGHYAVLGRPRPIASRAWAEGRRHLWRVLGTQLLISLTTGAILLASTLPAILLGTILHSTTAAAFSLLLLIPGLLGALYAGGRLLLAVPVTVLENKRPAAAMRRSWTLSHGTWWRGVGVACLARMIGYAATQLITTVAGTIATQLAPLGALDGTRSGQSFPLSASDLILPATVVVLAAVTAATLRAPLTPLTLGLLYIDRRIRLENLHTGLFAASVGTADHAGGQGPPFASPGPT